MTQRKKLARAKMSLIELAEYLKNVSEACRVMGVSRQHSPCGVRSVWLRYGLVTFKKRLIRLEEKAAQKGIVYTEAQLVALEQAKREKESDPEEIETHHPGYLIAQGSDLNVLVPKLDIKKPNYISATYTSLDLGRY